MQHDTERAVRDIVSALHDDVTEQPPHAVLNAGREIEEFALTLGSNEPVVTTAILSQTRSLYEAYETLIERNFVESVQSAQVPRLTEYPLWLRFRRLTQMEVTKTAMTCDTRVVFVGAGPFPVSAIQYHHMTGARIECLDMNTQAVRESSRVIAQFALDDSIASTSIAGECFDFGEADIVVIAVLTRNKLQILDRIAKSGKSSVRVVCRTTHGGRLLLYPMFPDVPETQWKTSDSFVAGKMDTIGGIVRCRL